MTLSLTARGDHWGDRTAVVDVSESRRDAPPETIDVSRYSYADLEVIATRFATDLEHVGIGAGDTVCVVSRNRVRVLALFFACHRLGVTFAPLSHRLTPATVSRPLEALDPDLVVAEEAQSDLVREVPPSRMVALDALGSADDTDGSDSNADSGSDSSTDSDPPIPLLAMHDETDPHRIATFSGDALEWTCAAVAGTLGLGRTDCTPLLLPLSAPDGLLRVVLPTLYSGGSVLLDRAFDPGDTLEALEHEPVTFLAGRETELENLAVRDGFVDAVSGLEWVLGDVPISSGVRNAFLECDVPVLGAYGRLECPTALVQPQSVALEGGSNDRTGDGGGGGSDGNGGGGWFRPLFDCHARLFEDDSVVTGAGEGVLEVAGPMLATGFDDTDTVEDGERRWLTTGDRFQREEGGYRPLDLE